MNGEATTAAAKRDFVEVLSGPEDGKSFELRTDVVTLGRHAGSEIFVPLELSVSRAHARLTRLDRDYELEILAEAMNPGRVD